MRKSRFTEEQIAGMLQESAARTKVSALCRKHGTFGYYAVQVENQVRGMTVSELRHMKVLKAKNSKNWRVC